MQREDLNFYLQQIDVETLKEHVAEIVDKEQVKVLVEPEQTTIMLPVQEPVAKVNFYAGEVLVTQCFVEVNGVKGWAMIQGINNFKAKAIAICDACFAQGIYVEQILKMAKQGLSKWSKQVEKYQKLSTETKVNFEVME